MSNDDLIIDYDGVQEALYAVRKIVDSYEDSSHDAQWMTGDQTSTKWGTEEAPDIFRKRHYEFLTALRNKINHWQDDLTTAMKRVDQAQERLRTASESEAAAINQTLVDEWVQGPDQA